MEINVGLRKDSGTNDFKSLDLGVLQFVIGNEEGDEEEEALMDSGNGVLKEKELRGC